MFVGIVNLRIFSSTILKGIVVSFEILIAQKKRNRNIENLYQKFVILNSSVNLSVQFYSMMIELQCKITKKYRKQQSCLTRQKDKRKITAHYSQNTFDVVRNRFKGI